MASHSTVLLNSSPSVSFNFLVASSSSCETELNCSSKRTAFCSCERISLSVLFEICAYYLEAEVRSVCVGVVSNSTDIVPYYPSSVSAFVAKRKAHDMDVFIRDSKARMSRMMDDDVHSFPTVPDQLALTLGATEKQPPPSCTQSLRPLSTRRLQRSTQRWCVLACGAL